MRLSKEKIERIYSVEEIADQVLGINVGFGLFVFSTSNIVYN